MPTGVTRFSVDETLSSVLQRDQTWQDAHDAAEVFFYGIDSNLIYFWDRSKFLERLDSFFGLDMLPMVDRFIATSGVQLTGQIVGKVSLTECFDIPAVLLEIKPKRPEGSQHRLEFLFNKDGKVLHAAVS